MILSAAEIQRQVDAGLIEISNFDESRLGPNSYNLSLSNKLLVYNELVLDMKRDNRTSEIVIPETGFELRPNTLYLGMTNELTTTRYPYVPMLEGRSSIGRLGISVHVTAGFGDVGFSGHWTLEITTTHHVIIYPEVEIAQIYFHQLVGENSKNYCGKYQNANCIQSSALYKELQSNASNSTGQSVGILR